MASIDIAMQSTSEEILSKLSSGVAGVNSRTKTFTQFQGGILNTSNITINGCGVLWLCPFSQSAQDKVTLTVDGVSGEFNIAHGPQGQSFAVYFERSVTFKESNGNGGTWFVQT